MGVLLQDVIAYLRRVKTWFIEGWNGFWFHPADPMTLAAVRICTGLVLLYIHATCFPYVLDFVGPQGWVDARACRELLDPDFILQYRSPFPLEGLSADERQELLDRIRLEDSWYAPSVWRLIEHPTWILVFHSVFLLAVVCFTLGLCSRTTAVIVWVGHLSYINRAFTIWFGMDAILLMITIYLMFGPTGATLSIDRLLARFREKRRQLRAGERRPVDLPAAPSWGANAVIRMIQVHMCIVYLAAGLAKLQGASWWKGIAGYYTIMIPEFRIFDLSGIAWWPDWALYLLATSISYGTLFFEISFCFLIWNRFLRPLFLSLAFALHAGIALFMGLGGFAAIMLTGCLAFVSPSSLRYVLEAVFKGSGGLRFVYDRHQPATVSAASMIKAADPWGQVTLVESGDRVTASAGTLILADGSTLRGLAALGKLVRSLRVLWLAWPLALWPFLSIGREELAPANATR